MNETGKILKSERLRRNLSIEEVSKATSIRTHIIEAIENGEYNVLPEVYIKSFIRKLCNLYEISDLSAQQEVPPAERKQEAAEPIATAEPDKTTTENADLEVEKPATKPVKKKKEKPKKIVTSTEVSQSKDYTEIFRKRRVRFSVNPVFINYIIISAIAIFLLLVIYFVFFFDTKKFFEEQRYVQDTATEKTENNIENKLTEFFNKSDSIVIKAVARDTAWMRIEIDGARSEELLMYPGMERSWNVGEFAIVHQGNFGAIRFYRNDELLEIPGKRGTVVKNVRITASEVLNANPWAEDPTSRVDAIENVPKNIRRYNQKKDEQIKLIQPSEPIQKKPLIKDSIR
ncbi:MAG: helix-turn-helix transcriptional regulator [Bacteroidota bacterium]